jgi:hypothetical protein
MSNMEDEINTTKNLLEELQVDKVFPWNKPSDLECIEMTVERLLRNKNIKHLKNQQAFIDTQQKWISEQKIWIEKQQKWIDEQQNLICIETKKIINRTQNNYDASNETEDLNDSFSCKKKTILDYSTFTSHDVVETEDNILSSPTLQTNN